MIDSNGHYKGNGQIEHANHNVPKEVYALVKEEIKEPPLNMQYIHTIATAKKANGKSDIEEQANREFRKANAALSEQCVGAKGILDRSLSGLAGDKQRLLDNRNSINPYIEKHNP